MLHTDIAGMKPTTGKRLIGSCFVLVIPDHHTSAPNNHFALRYTIGEQLVAVWLYNCNLRVLQHGLPLACESASALGDAQLSSMVLWFIDGGRTICFRQTIDMHRSDPQVFQALNNRRRRCRSCRNQTRGTIESMCTLGFDNRCRNNRCTT